ncbi:ABC transporter permease [Parapedobacter koreensis]|uniref:Duplicated orphan permease n=1 Tax=Parapedobacter koreensis TaxID=332977 RepID=A0A1H7R3Q4_9SPHI|nr:ABC transporter permease [Parapedobacter koreensis]SEL54545.1 duplicated orphan permease [Parapedobacter koreensis]
MIKNYFKTTFRNLWKTRGYSFLNIFGLAVGITAASLIFLWVEDEVNFDDHFPNKALIYEVKSEQHYGENTFVFAATPGKLADAIKAEIPEIADATRVDDRRSKLFSIGDKNLNQTGAYVDPAFIHIFSLNFLEGDRKTALQDINSLVISSSMAKRLFGNDSALGKTVKVDNGESYTVTGVVEDMLNNSSIRFNWLIPFKNYERTNRDLQNWGSNSTNTIVLLKPNADLTAANSKLHHFIAEKQSDEHPTSSNFLYPMERWRLYNSFKDGVEQEGRIKYVRLFSIVAWIVLLIACINFMNLATARSEKRAKEVGMRKVVGAKRSSLIIQFLAESVMLATLSSLLAVGISHLAIGAFNNLVEKQLIIDLFRPTHLLFLAGIVLVCGTLSGIYPAFYLSSFNPISTLKGDKQKAGATSFIRRGLVILQYAASITLITCTSIIYQQIKYVKDRDMGFDRSQLLTTSILGNMPDRIAAIKTQLQQIPGVEQVGLSNLNILSIYSNGGAPDWEGKDPNMNMLVGFMQTDADFIPTMGLQLVDGRNYRPNMLGDSTSIIINEAFAKVIKPDGKVAGQSVWWGSDNPLTIIGVVKDFVYNNVYTPADPLLFYPMQSANGVMNIRTKAGVDLGKTVVEIEKTIKTFNPEYPFEYNFLDDLFDQKFKSEMLIQKLAGVFAVLSIIISCLGLFGLAAFTAERRTKEMGIRKVLGASVASLVGMLNREFVILVLVSCAVAFPIAWWLMSDWLSDYQYHTDLHWWVFALAGVGALVIALLTVSSQAIKAALMNPTKSLRDE